MSEPLRVIILLLLGFLLYFGKLGQIPFYNYAESKEALVVWEMVHGGGWILPLRNGTEIPRKPPLFHWVGSSVALLAGQVNEFTVRFPSAFFATATVLLTFFFGRAVWNWKVGFLAALILATSPEWARWATYARSDMVLVFFLTAAGVAFFQLWQEGASRWRTIYLFYLSIGLAILAKGPLGLILPALVVLCFVGISREFSFLRRMKLAEGTAIVLLVAASWYLLALWQAGDDFFRRQILSENIYRFLESDQGGPSRDHAFYFYLPALFTGMFPWSLFFPALILLLYYSRRELRDKKLLYPIVWCLVGLVFFSLASGKRSNYLLPLYPMVALLCGVWWQELIQGTLTSSPLMTRLTWGGALVLGTGFTLAVFVLVAYSVGVDLDHIVAPFLHSRDQANLSSVAHTLQNQFPLLLIWLTILILALGWYFWELRRGRWSYVFAALTIVVSSSLYFTNALFHPMLARERTYKPFMHAVRLIVKDAPLYFYNAYDYGAIFYADRHIPAYKDNLPQLAVAGDPSTPLYLLMWEEEWQKVSTTIGTAERQLEPLVTSEGRGPHKKHRLVLVALPHSSPSPDL